mmetsp:Transcript_832/g.1260  ORF Transcript_832/g.1260 Transcript_832/m.1260 type:complete len:148 (-) Transcript_832:1058-1501(-)
MENSNPQSGFYQLAEGYEHDLQAYMTRMRCVIDEDKPLMSIHGDWNTARLANLMVVFEMCDPKKSYVSCKSDEEIKQWMTFKYFLIMANSNRFIKHGFGEDRMLSRSRLIWLSLSSRMRTDFVNKVMRTSSELNDNLLNFGSFNRVY